MRAIRLGGKRRHRKTISSATWKRIALGIDDPIPFPPPLPLIEKTLADIQSGVESGKWWVGHGRPWSDIVTASSRYSNHD